MAVIVYITSANSMELVSGPTADLYDANLANLAGLTGRLRILCLRRGAVRCGVHPRIPNVELVTGTDATPCGLRDMGLTIRRWSRWVRDARVIYLPVLSAHIVLALYWRHRWGIRVAQRMTWSAAQFARLGRVSRRDRYLTELFQRLACRFADRVGAGSQALMEEAIHYGAHPSRVCLTSNFADTEQLRQKIDYQSYSPIRLGSIGRLSGQKNFALLIQAAGRLGNAVRVELVGEGSLRPSLKELAARVQAPVELLEQIPHTALLDRLAGWDAYVQPSHFEGTPKALLEAMGAGLPCIGNDVPGITDFLSGGRGLLFNGTVEGLMAPIRQLAADEDERRRLGQAARTYVLSHHTRKIALAQDRQMIEGVIRTMQSGIVG